MFVDCFRKVVEVCLRRGEFVKGFAERNCTVAGIVEAEGINESIRRSIDVNEAEFDFADTTVIGKVKKLVDLMEFLSERGHKSG